MKIDRESEQELGALLAVYDPEPSTRRASGCLLGCVILAVAGCGVALADSPGNVVAWLGAIGGIFVVVALARDRKRKKAAAVRVELCRNAMVHECNATGRRVFSWSDVRSIRNRLVRVVDQHGRERRVDHRHVVILDDGEEIEMIGSGASLEELHVQLRAVIHHTLVPRMRASIADGKTVKVGNVKLSRVKIVFGPESRYWSEITRVDVEEGVLRIVDRDDHIWLERELGDLDDGEALVVLARELSAVAGPTSS